MANDIIIHGISMPESCKKCRLSHYDEDGYLVCSCNGDPVEWFTTSRPKDCPLEEIKGGNVEENKEWFGEKKEEEKPTDKQIWAVNLLFGYLTKNNISYSRPDYTKTAYVNFIKKYEKEYNEAKRSRKYTRSYYLKRSYYNKRSYCGIDDGDNDYCGPYGTDIVDCYDYGIFPWGNS